MSYLIENKECERSFLRRLWGYWNSLGSILTALDFNPHCCWALIEVDMCDLGTSLKGDVDILIGHTTWKDSKQYEAAFNEQLEAIKTAHPNALIQLMNPYNAAANIVAWSGGIQWPPSTEYLVGIEVKCSRLGLDVNPYKGSIDKSDMRSTKSSPQKIKRIRLEIDKLLNLGLDKVALLDLIANPPADGINMDAWANASVIADKTEKAMARVINDRLPSDSIAGHWVYSLGAVAGGDELIRGSGYPNQYRMPQENKFVSSAEIANWRQMMKQNITSIFNKMPNPNSLPALYINCRVCRTIHRCAMDDSCSQ
jgi:hypothetical protein